MQYENSIWERIGKLILTVILFGLITIILLAVSRVLFLNSIYAFFLGWITTEFGIDLSFARPVSVLLTAAAILILPWTTAYLIFGRKSERDRMLIAAAIGSLIFFAGTYYSTGRVYFNRSSGEYTKCYLKTLEGFRFSTACDYDPKFGMKYQPITKEVMKEIYLWEKSGKLKNIPDVVPGEYFDQLTGEPTVWYSVHPTSGKFRLFPLPGFDSLTGEQLKPISKEIVSALEQAGFEKVETGSSTHTVPIDRYISDIIQHGKYDTDSGYEQRVLTSWYLDQKEGFMTGNAAHQTHYSVSVEKVLQINDYIVIGVLYQGNTRGDTETSLAEIKFSPEGSFFDLENHPFRPLKHLDGNELDAISTATTETAPDGIEAAISEIYTDPVVPYTVRETLYSSETVRMLYILPSSAKNLLRGGKFQGDLSESGRFLVEFQRRK